MEHLKSWEAKYPNLVDEIRKGLYVDDLMTGGATEDEVKEKKTESIEIFEDATFKLHKWHSNIETLEAPSPPCSDENFEITFAKQQLGSQPETKLFGLGWDKRKDSISVVKPDEVPATTKRNALSQLAKLYDPLGLVSPMTLLGKNLFREMCESRISWDVQFTETMVRDWEKWHRQMPENYEVPRSLAPYQQPVSAITLHAFGDASKTGVAAAVYAVVEQLNGTTQGLVCAKSRLAKRNLTIPRLELVAGHMAIKLATNVERAINQNRVKAVHCWLDSTVALYWINGQGDFRQFVANRVAKIQEHNHVKWHHVSTHENPADLGSRGGKVVGDELWKYGPHWLKDQSQWPPQTTLRASPEAIEELKAVMSSRALVTVNPPAERDTFSDLLEKFPLRKVLRICAWISRFHENCRATQRERQYGPLTTADIRVRELWWIRKTQIEAAESPEFDKTKVHLNIQPNLDGILECRGRIDGEYPAFLPSASIFTRKVVERAHLSTLHGGVSMTMAKVRERYWVPKLRRLVKHVRSKCYGCLRFRAGAYGKPPPGKLPSTRTQGTTPFQVVGVDFAGPIRYVTRNKAERKAYLLLYGCSLTRAIHLEVLKSMETSEFITSLKRFIARRGRPKLIYSDNAKTFKSAAKWLGKVQQEERFHAFLADNAVEWRFNLSRAPWWGGQYERLIGLFKRAFHKTIGNGTLTWEELEEVALDVEVTLNNRPLNYLEDDVEFSVLTPSSMLNVNPYLMPEMKPHQIEEMDLRKRAKFLHKCKQAVWKRWAREYVRGLRERHRQEIGTQISYPKIGEVVIVWDEDRNRNKWKLGIVSELIEGKDNIIRGAQVRTANGKLERAIQHLYPLELSCDKPKWNPNPSAPTYTPRSQRDAAVAAKVRLQQQAEVEDQ